MREKGREMEQGGMRREGGEWIEGKGEGEQGIKRKVRG